MKIIVAGAGAGKTTSMAQLVWDRFKEITDGKIIYVITYTNFARNRIREKIVEINGSIPKQIFIETFHVFLLREFIFPFHHILFEEQFTKVSQIKLSDNAGYKAMKIKELITNKIIHVEKVTETAKWIICRKTNDRKSTKEKREKVLMIVSRYLDSVYIDEAQDMDKNLVEIIEVLGTKGINLCLVGDPKQDLRGRNAFKNTIHIYKQQVEYISENHRCPISHVKLANTFISQEEMQSPQKTGVGELSFLFESDVEINDFINSKEWDYVFIHQKNKRFSTHTDDRERTEHTLSYELKSLVKKMEIKETEIDKFVHSIKKIILKILESENNISIFNRLEELLSYKLTRIDKGKIAGVLNQYRVNLKVEGVVVRSIDSIKGLEGNRCLFILTADLAPYLFAEKAEQNKMLNYLYVALTRAKEELVFLVSIEVEALYGRGKIVENFKILNINSQ